jgi:transcriptional regulator with XRE-family HTH domain
MPKNIALKIAIVESGLSQIEVAKAADLHESRLSHIINGHRDPSGFERRVLARILKRKPADLFPDEAKAS